MQFSLNNYLSYYLPYLATWQGMVAIGAFLLMGFLLVMVDKTKWALLALLLWFSTFGVSDKGSERGLLPIFENIRPLSRVIDNVLLGLMLIPMVMSPRGRRSRLLGGGALALLFFELVMSVRHFYDNSADRAILGIITFILIFGVLAFGVSRWIQRAGDEMALLYCIMTSAIMLSVGSIIQLVLNSGGALAGRQLAGTTENPNSFGANIGLALPIACYLLVAGQTARFWRITAGFFVAAGTVLLLWSGSRSSVLGAAVAILILFRTRLRLWMVATLVVGVVLGVVMWGFGIDITGLEHLSSTGNSRTIVWGVMWDQFINNPLFGVGGEGLHENSYLGTAAAFGLAGLVPLFFALLFIFRDVARAGRTIKAVKGDRLLSNLLWGWLLGALIMSIFESHLAGTFTYFIYCFYLMLTLMVAASDPPPHEAGFEVMQDDEMGADFDPSLVDSASSFGGRFL